MPKSRGRKPKPGGKRTHPGSGRDRHLSRTVAVDGNQGMRALTRLAPDQLVETGLPFFWLMRQIGNPAYVCLDSALALRSAYAQFGVTVEPKTVKLVVGDPADSRASGYGTDAPRIDAKNRFHGHMGLWLPRSCQFVDHTVVQFPEVRAVNGWPVVLMLGAGGMTDWEQAQDGFVTDRGRLRLAYTPWPDIVGDAELRTGADDHVRFVLPGTEQTGGVYLDEIRVD